MARSHGPLHALPRDASYAERHRAVAHLVGNTPLLAIDLTFGGESRTVYAKLETRNLSGSVKDRPVLHALRQAAAEGRLRSGARLVASGRGNALLACAALGTALGHRVALFVVDDVPAEYLARLHALGADIQLVPGGEGAEANAWRDAAALASETPGAVSPLEAGGASPGGAWEQAHERSTGPELWWQLAPLGLAPDAFVAGVGSGATIAGAGRYLRDNDRSVALYPVEPSSAPLRAIVSAARAASPTAPRITAATHRIRGLADRAHPPTSDLTRLDAPIAIDEGDALLMAQALGRSLGLGVGVSSGANLLASLVAQERLGRDAVVATLFCDTHASDLAAGIGREEPSRQEFLSRHVVLRGFRVIAPLPASSLPPSDLLNAPDASTPAPSEAPPDR